MGVDPCATHPPPSSRGGWQSTAATGSVLSITRSLSRTADAAVPSRAECEVCSGVRFVAAARGEVPARNPEVRASGLHRVAPSPGEEVIRHGPTSDPGLVPYRGGVTGRPQDVRPLLGTTSPKASASSGVFWVSRAYSASSSSARAPPKGGGSSSSPAL